MTRPALGFLVFFAVSLISLWIGAEFYGSKHDRTPAAQCFDLLDKCHRQFMEVIGEGMDCVNEQLLERQSCESELSAVRATCCPKEPE